MKKQIARRFSLLKVLRVNFLFYNLVNGVIIAYLKLPKIALMT